MNLSWLPAPFHHLKVRPTANGYRADVGQSSDTYASMMKTYQQEVLTPVTPADTPISRPKPKDLLKQSPGMVYPSTGNLELTLSAVSISSDAGSFAVDDSNGYSGFNPLAIPCNQHIRLSDALAEGAGMFIHHLKSAFNISELTPESLIKRALHCYLSDLSKCPKLTSLDFAREGRAFRALIVNDPTETPFDPSGIKGRYRGLCAALKGLAMVGDYVDGPQTWAYSARYKAKRKGIEVTTCTRGMPPGVVRIKRVA